MAIEGNQELILMEDNANTSGCATFHDKWFGKSGKVNIGVANITACNFFKNT